MPMHAERDIVIANPSVGALHSAIVSKEKHISSNSFHPWWGMTLVCERYRRYKIPGEVPHREH